MMFGRFFFILIIFLALAGCAYNHEPMPEIVGSRPVSSENQSVQPRPTIEKPAPALKTVDRNVPKGWQPPFEIERKWNAIVIHHSATSNGNADIFDRWHREGNHWEGVGYDFVIGNGIDSADGEVEVTFRWRQQRTGAHCKTPDNWANENAVGICLVGDFNNTAPTSRQMQSLVKLTRFLQKRYGIPQNRIYGHNNTPGARVTDCPGKKFPMAWFKSTLEF